MRQSKQSYQSGERFLNGFNFTEQCIQQRPVCGSIGIERSIPFTRLMFDGDVQSELAFRVELQVRVRLRNFENDYYCSILEIPFMDIKRCWVKDATCAYELYIEGFGSSEHDRKELVLISVRKFGQNAEERRKLGMRTIEGLETKNGISYRYQEY
jgi:hypothetical protein